MIAARCLGSNRILLDAVGSRRFERAMRELVAMDRTESRASFIVCQDLREPTPSL